MKATQICTVDDCDRPMKARGWCGTHHERWRKHGTVAAPVRPSACAVDACTRQAPYIRGWCKYHWQRWSRYGHPTEGGGTHRGSSSGRCAVTGCDRSDSARGWCKAHAHRERVHGDPEAGPPLREPRAADWVPGYSAVHRRVTQAYGAPATAFACVDCGGAGEHWSYDHNDPDQLLDEITGLTYSLDPEHYDPRCVRCHRRYDAVVA